MEIVISIGLGLLLSLASLVAIWMISRDIKKAEKNENKEETK